MNFNLKALVAAVALAAIAGPASAVAPSPAIAVSQTDLLFLAIKVVATVSCLNLAIRFIAGLVRRISTRTPPVPHGVPGSLPKAGRRPIASNVSPAANSALHLRAYGKLP